MSSTPRALRLPSQATGGLALAPGRSYDLGGTLGRVFIEGRLSRSPEAAVYAIRSYSSGPLVLKVIDLARTPRAAVSRAYVLQRRCRSPLVVAALGLHMRARFAYLVMERPRGPSLEAALLQQQRRGERPPLRLMLQQFAYMAAAAALCHSRGVVHRDLKPSNFVLTLTAPGAVKLTDFGLAHDPIQALHPGAGTTTFMAPELLRGAPGHPAGDVWSLGIALFCMVVGIEPHYADDEALVAAQVLAGAPPFTVDDLALFLAAQQPPRGVLEGILGLYQAATRQDAAARPAAALLAQQAARLALMLPLPALP